MALEETLREQIVATWRTNHRTTVFLLENLPAELWPVKVPGAPRRTVRMIAGHLHNCRCMWIKMLGLRHGLAPPPGVDRHRVEPAELLVAHEGHHRGQICMIARQSGFRLPPEVTAGLWQWSKRAKEASTSLE